MSVEFPSGVPHEPVTGRRMTRGHRWTVAIVSMLARVASGHRWPRGHRWLAIVSTLAWVASVLPVAFFVHLWL